ncbi:MAG TPA: ACT domain-containing protein [Nevskiaceae bacterium]|nr:ACT domain-containing protein [Nevskiaceae bacterium]
MKTLVLSVMADDRPGLVKAISNVVVDHGGNWLESRFALLSGKFAGIVNVEVPAQRADALIAALDALKASGVELLVSRSGAAASAASGTEIELEIVGADHPGIVHEITELLATRGVNVEEMSSDRKAASMSGTAIFEARLRVRVPAGSDQASLRSDLEELARDLVVEVRFTEQDAKRG